MVHCFVLNPRIKMQPISVELQSHALLFCRGEKLLCFYWMFVNVFIILKFLFFIFVPVCLKSFGITYNISMALYQ